MVVPWCFTSDSPNESSAILCVVISLTRDEYGMSSGEAASEASGVRAIAAATVMAAALRGWRGTEKW